MVITADVLTGDAITYYIFYTHNPYIRDDAKTSSQPYKCKSMYVSKTVQNIHKSQIFKMILFQQSTP